MLLGAFALGLWGTVLRPAAYEVRGEVVARPAPDLILVRHQAVTALGMGPMETMGVSGDPAVFDSVSPGDRVRMAVRQQGDTLVVIWIERTSEGPSAAPSDAR
ncbi:MAG: copper-binding protein [bacterium]